MFSFIHMFSVEELENTIRSLSQGCKCSHKITVSDDALLDVIRLYLSFENVGSWKNFRYFFHLDTIFELWFLRILSIYSWTLQIREFFVNKSLPRFLQLLYLLRCWTLLAKGDELILEIIRTRKTDVLLLFLLFLPSLNDNISKLFLLLLDPIISFHIISPNLLILYDWWLCIMKS